jgi:hypothetical protein
MGFTLDITATAQPGATNTLEVVVWKPTNELTGGGYGVRTTLAGFLRDMATTFGGLWQSARLCLGADGFYNLRIDPDPDTGAIRVRGAVTLDERNRSQRGCSGMWQGRRC